MHKDFRKAKSGSICFLALITAHLNLALPTWAAVDPAAHKSAAATAAAAMLIVVSSGCLGCVVLKPFARRSEISWGCWEKKAGVRGTAHPHKPMST